MIPPESPIKNSFISLVPFAATHVQQYYEWLLDEQLRKETGTEPMTLQEVEEKANSWEGDRDTLAMIILDAKGEMVGDIDLRVDAVKDQGEMIGEITIMIPTRRGEGYGEAALLLFLDYLLTRCATLMPLTAFRARIHKDNIASLNLFEKVGFKKHKYAHIFHEWELRFPIVT